MSTISHQPLRAVFAVAASAVLALGLASAARAAGGRQVDPEADHPVSVVLSFEPGQLSTPGGIAELHREIARAAEHVCGAYLRWEGGIDTTECRIEATDDAEHSLSIMLARRNAATQVASAP